MKLPVGSKEREEMRRQVELEIITQAEKWERARSAIVGTNLSYDSLEFRRVANAANKLARLVRKWRKL
jgi:hypothetical protein